MRVGALVSVGLIGLLAVRCGEPQRCSHCDSFGFRLAPGEVNVSPVGLTIEVGAYDCLDACFACDLNHRSDDGSVRWMSLDTSIATVSPAVNRHTRVTGIREGRTVVRAIILGVTADATVIVIPPSRLGPGPFQCSGLE